MSVDTDGGVACGVCTGTTNGVLVGGVGVAAGVGADDCGVAVAAAVDFCDVAGGVDWFGSINRMATAG
jgi:hypothetical protein